MYVIIPQHIRHQIMWGIQVIWGIIHIIRVAIIRGTMVAIIRGIMTAIIRGTTMEAIIPIISVAGDLVIEDSVGDMVEAEDTAAGMVDMEGITRF
jgi:hypothetical protein